MKMRRVAAAGAAAGILCGSGMVFGDSPYASYSNGPPTNPDFFPIGVWYQNLTSSIINGYAAMGINVYDYPSSVTAAQLTMIKNAGMYAVIPYDATEVNNKTVIAWFNPPDEPDNAQANGSGGYGDPIQPSVIIAQYNAIKAEDPTRPVLLNLGQAVAWPDANPNGSDSYYGRGSRTDHPEDYGYNSTYTWTNGQTYTGGYTAGSDIAAFDFYPENSTDAAVEGQINLVGAGVTRLINWSPPGHPVWNYIETTDITVGDSAPGPTPVQVKAEVWLSLVHGSMGIMYFAHQFPEPPNPSDELLLNTTMNPAVTAINAQVEALAPELNSTTIEAATISTGAAASAVSIDFMTKVVGGNEYLFAVGNQTSNGTALFRDPAQPGLSATVTVIGENRTLAMVNGAFTDPFANNTVHLYEIMGVSSYSPELTALTNYIWSGTTNGNWDTTSTDKNWTTLAWSNNATRSAAYTATFNLATPSTVTVNGNIDVSNMTFTTGGWTLGAGTGVMAFGGTGAININAVTGTDTLDAAIVNGSSFGAGGGVTGLAISGLGTVVLGGANSYTGGTTISNGSLTIAAAGALPGGTAVFNNGKFQINAASVAGAISGTGATTVAASTSLTAHSIQQGTLTVNGTFTLAGTPLVTGTNRNPNATTSVLGALTLAGGTAPTATLNLNNNVLVLSNGGAAGLSTVEAQIAHARNGGLWNHTGITSTSAQTAFAAATFDAMTLGDILNSSLPAPYTTFGGVNVNPNDVLVAFTYGGDANLDGVVNGDDYFQIDQGFDNQYTGWINGDFNHDGAVNGDDYFIIDSNFINQSGQLAASEVLAHAAEFGPSYLSGFTGAQLAAIGVPEPGSLALLGLAAAGLLFRRRRRRVEQGCGAERLR